MKNIDFKTFTLFAFTMFISISVNAQLNDLYSVAPQKKGEIMLSNGTTVTFNNLKVVEGDVYYETKAGLQQQVPGTDVYKITKTGNYAALYGVSCAAGGLLGGIAGTSNWDESGLGDQKTGFIIGATVVCGAVGTIVGFLVKKRKVVYRNTDLNLSLNNIRIYALNEDYYALSLKINLK